LKTPLILATRNPGKLRELRAMLADLPVEVLPLPDDAPDVPETAATFAGNAELKARGAWQATGDRRQATAIASERTAPPLTEPVSDPDPVACRLSPVAWVLADDSGLEVDALGGAPGVFSARYAGPGATDADNVAKLLEALRGMPDEARIARFRCSLALLAPDGCLRSVDGVCEGRIAHAPRGTGGFGYDPVFLLPDRGLTVAELPPEEKNRISHRGQALARAVELLRGLL
jgi:XTP/dITP diphosphohydrolase